MKPVTWKSIFTGLLLPVLLAGCSSSGDDSDGMNSAKTVSVTVAQAETQDVRVELNSIGRLISRNAPTLSSEINARVTEVLVDEGESVESGQELIRLDTTNTELARREAIADIQRLEVSIDNEERRVERYQGLMAKGMMSRERLDDAEAKLAADRASLTAALARLAIAEDRLAKASLTSPVGGVVEQRFVSVGDYVKTGGPMIMVTDTTELRAELPFPETVGSRIRVGQELILESPLAPGQKVRAEISQIRPQVGSLSRALVVVADIRNPGPWRPEATVEATAVIELREDAVTVPSMAVVRRPAGQVVYVVDSDHVRQQVVEPGLTRDGFTEIRAGLDSGSTVVVEGAHYLSDGARIEVQEAGP